MGFPRLVLKGIDKLLEQVSHICPGGKQVKPEFVTSLLVASQKIARPSMLIQSGSSKSFGLSRNAVGNPGNMMVGRTTKKRKSSTSAGWMISMRALGSSVSSCAIPSCKRFQSCEEVDETLTCRGTQDLDLWVQRLPRVLWAWSWCVFFISCT